MNKRLLVAATAIPLSLALAASAALASPTGAEGVTIATASGQVGTAVKDFDVFVDLPTGFAFVKTPRGWTFVRKLDAAQLKSLPASTLISLAVNDTDGGQTQGPASL